MFFYLSTVDGGYFLKESASFCVAERNTPRYRCQQQQRSRPTPDNTDGIRLYRRQNSALGLPCAFARAKSADSFLAHQDVTHCRDGLAYAARSLGPMKTLSTPSVAAMASTLSTPR